MASASIGIKEQMQAHDSPEKFFRSTEKVCCAPDNSERPGQKVADAASMGKPLAPFVSRSVLKATIENVLRLLGFVPGETPACKSPGESKTSSRLEDFDCLQLKAQSSSQLDFGFSKAESEKDEIDSSIASVVPTLGPSNCLGSQEKLSSSLQTSKSSSFATGKLSPSVEGAGVCRVCHSEITSAELFVLDCGCQGKGLAVMHEECAIMWFSYQSTR
jgi:hypothetical protein